MTEQILTRRKKRSILLSFLFLLCALNIHSINSALGNNDATKPNNVESASEAVAEAGRLAEASANTTPASTASKDPYAATVSAALSSMNINSVAANATNATMNNGRKDNTDANVQKLQQQLNDIKEQVSIWIYRSKDSGFFSN